jgi:hypothetical protein
MEQIGLEIDGPQLDLLDCKFEHECLRCELFVLAAVDGGDIEFWRPRSAWIWSLGSCRAWKSAKSFSTWRRRRPS